jgi:hypothetical protein
MFVECFRGTNEKSGEAEGTKKDYMKLKIIDNDLCLINRNSNTILKRYKPIFKIAEFKRVKDNCIIIRENTDSYSEKQSNIYCLDDNLNLKWFSELPTEKDTFPNTIQWNKKLKESDDLRHHTIENENTLTCASWRCFTVSIEYDTGKIIASIFTK